MATPALALNKISEHLSAQPRLESWDALDVSPLETDEFRAKMDRELAIFEDRVNRWIERGHSIRDDMWAAASNAKPDPAYVAIYSKFIDDMDELIKGFAKSLRKELSSLEKQTRRGYAVSSQVGQTVDALVKRSFAAVERELQEGSDFVLFLRAVRAQFDIHSRGGPTFDDSKKLRAYLKNALK